MARISMLTPHFDWLIQMYKEGKTYTEMLEALRKVGVECTLKNLRERIKARLQKIKIRKLELQTAGSSRPRVSRRQVREALKSPLPSVGTRARKTAKSSTNGITHSDNPNQIHTPGSPEVFDQGISSAATRKAPEISPAPTKDIMSDDLLSNHSKEDAKNSSPSRHRFQSLINLGVIKGSKSTEMSIRNHCHSYTG